MARSASWWPRPGRSGGSPMSPREPRWRGRTVLLIVGIAVTVATVLSPARASAAQASPAGGGSCQGGPVAVLGCLASPSRLAGTVAQAAGQQVMQGVTGWITDAAAWFLA